MSLLARSTRTFAAERYTSHSDSQVCSTPAGKIWEATGLGAKQLGKSPCAPRIDAAATFPRASQGNSAEWQVLDQDSGLWSYIHRGITSISVFAPPRSLQQSYARMANRVFRSSYIRSRREPSLLGSSSGHLLLQALACTALASVRGRRKALGLGRHRQVGVAYDYGCQTVALHPDKMGFEHT